MYEESNVPQDISVAKSINIIYSIIVVNGILWYLLVISFGYPFVILLFFFPFFFVVSPPGIVSFFVVVGLKTKNE